MKDRSSLLALTAVRRQLRALRSLLVVAASMVAVATTASGQITFAGTTSFQFNGTGGFASSQTLGGLTLTNNGFHTVTDPVSFIGNVGGLTSNFGAVSLTNQNFVYGGNTVQLMLTFLSPTVSSQTFFATLLGRVVTVGNQGGLSIVFSPSAITGIPFSNGPGSGTLSVAVNNVDITPGQVDEDISGRIIAVTPEPASIVLLATGLVGVAGLARRRKSITK
jgi:PEP-CTERM motif